MYKACPSLQKLENVPHDNEECESSRDILKDFNAIMLQQYSPRSIIGDGNCLYRTVSLGLYGTQNYHEYLRIIASIELTTNKGTYDGHDTSELFTNCLVPISNYEELLTACKTSHFYSEMAHIYCLSAALGVVIQSYMPPLTAICLGLSPYTRRIAGRCVRRIESPRCVLMWIMLVRPKRIQDFKPNHFVLLAEKRSIGEEKVKEDLVIIGDSEEEFTGMSYRQVLGSQNLGI